MEPLEAALALQHPPVPVSVLAAVAELLPVVPRVVLVPHQRIELVGQLLPRRFDPMRANVDVYDLNFEVETTETQPKVTRQKPLFIG